MKFYIPSKYAKFHNFSLKQNGRFFYGLTKTHIYDDFGGKTALTMDEK